MRFNVLSLKIGDDLTMCKFILSQKKNMRKFLIIILLSISANALAQYRGKVFVDSNKNGSMDPGERPIARVRVSDGLNVTGTKEDGSFSLAGYTKTRFIFITAPAGYRPSKNHYLPAKGVDSVYNFGLVADSSLAGSEIRMMHISDTETYVYGDWISNVRNFVQDKKAAFVVHTGDICYEKGLNFHALQVNESRLKKPVHYAMGNHDLVKGPYGEAMFESLFGPPYYSFDAGPGHFIITPMASGDFKPDYTTDQLIAWIRNDLKFTDKGRPVFIFNHNLPFTKKGSFVLKGAADSIDLAKNGLKAWVYGHWHSNFVGKDERTGIYSICTSALNKGGIDNSAGQFLTIDIDRLGVKKILPHYAYFNQNITIIQPAAGNMNLIRNDKLAVSVNSYDTELAVKSIEASIFDQKGNKISTGKLAPANAWNWGGEIGGTAQWKGTAFRISVEIWFADGSSKIQYQDFEIGKDRNRHLALQWNGHVDGNVWNAAPLIVNDMIFVATLDDAGNQQSGITALNNTSGKVVWEFKTRNSVKHAICYEDGKLLATDVEGNVYALNAVSGKLLWKRNLGMNYLPANLTGSVLRDGVYYTGFGKYLQAIKVSNGETLWTNTAWSAGMGSPAKMVLADNILLVGSNWNALFAHDIKTGKLLWKRDDEGLRYRSGPPAVENGLVYITGAKTLFVLDLKTGQTVNKSVTDFSCTVMGAPLITEKTIVVATTEHGVVAFDKVTLKQMWNTKVGEALIYSAPYSSPDPLKPILTVEPSVVENGSKLLFGASDGYFYEIDKDMGKIITKINLGAPIYAEASIKDNRCYVATFDGGIYCFKL